MLNNQKLLNLIEKYKGERTFFDHELVGVFFTLNHLENLIDEVIKECLITEQPAQEPVAWTDEYKNFLEWDKESLCDKAVCKDHEAIPLYTHPAPSWQGLSDNEIARLVIINEVDKSGDTGFAKLIEQALKEKNT